ncbi:hypothetical protein [Natrialba sp. SSL1]|uniref:hypothetical protein n=1 Tax=Natrialba sp. SSL1 TaxID=1869245 RepID=UPI0008F9545D|nr:hypothetical protein [Natrialba sp. SSL1]OIB58066.1 hypothetical protein BBD46_10415 [Natrialba sp. SSL1]
MTDDDTNTTRRRVLQTSGITFIAGGALTSTATAETQLVSVAPDALELPDCEDATDSFTVQIDGPPFGRTDVEISADGVDASPESFQLSGRNDAETVTVGPGEGTVTVTATTPRGDSQTETIDVTCLGEPDFNWGIQTEDPIELWAITGRPDDQTIEVMIENEGTGPGETTLTIDNEPDERWMESWGYSGETEKTIDVAAGESVTTEFTLTWSSVTDPDDRYGWDVIVETDDDREDQIRIEMIDL